MAYNLIRKEDYNTYVVNHFLCDEETDLDTILSDYASVEGKEAIYPGWDALVTDPAVKKFILANDKQTWVELPIIPSFPDQDGTYTLKAEVSGGVTTLSWGA